MPIHLYLAQAEGCATCCNGFEVLQRLGDPPLTHCGTCGAGLRRAISAPSIAVGGAHLLKESHVARSGFTQYRRAGRGVYEKTAGKGPDFISGD